MAIAKCVTGIWLTVFPELLGFASKVKKVVDRESKNQKNILDSASAEPTSRIPAVAPSLSLSHQFFADDIFVDKQIAQELLSRALTRSYNDNSRRNRPSNSRSLSNCRVSGPSRSRCVGNIVMHHYWSYWCWNYRWQNRGGSGWSQVVGKKFLVDAGDLCSTCL